MSNMQMQSNLNYTQQHQHPQQPHNNNMYGQYPQNIQNGNLNMMNAPYHNNQTNNGGGGAYPSMMVNTGYNPYSQPTHYWENQILK